MVRVRDLLTLTRAYSPPSLLIVLFHRLSSDSCSACLLPTVHLGKYASQALTSKIGT
jgi:hypothetical protein